ncbi:MAG TPA: hypothetical protein ENH75_02290 [archaeon]|nr:hypothetical protein [archaeon]
MIKDLIIKSTKSESIYHKAIKQLIFKSATEKNNPIREKSLEKYFDNRRADVYFKLKSGDEIVAEVQNSKITVKEIRQRTEDYNKKNIFVLWILHGMGSCVASPKLPKDIKDTKISTTENFLHRIYFGRVYYINLDFTDSKTTFSAPFALHFSPSWKKKNRKMFHSHYDKYFIRNINYTKIPSWNLLTVNYNGFKLARFYDKNIKSILKKEIFKFVLNELTNSQEHCKYKIIRKLILNRFSCKYGRYLTLDSFSDLIKEKKLDLEEKYILKIKKEIH